jgi:hypothetical protein
MQGGALPPKCIGFCVYFAAAAVDDVGAGCIGSNCVVGEGCQAGWGEDGLLERRGKGHLVPRQLRV